MEILKSSIIVKKFLDEGSGKHVGVQEMSTFWKSCSEEEKLRFTQEAVTLMPELAPPVPA